MLERFSSSSKQAKCRLFQMPCIADTIFFMTNVFRFSTLPLPPPSPRSSLLVYGPSTQSPAPGSYKNFNHIKFPVLKSIYIGHVNGLWVLIAL